MTILDSIEEDVFYLVVDIGDFAADVVEVAVEVTEDTLGLAFDMGEFAVELVEVALDTLADVFCDVMDFFVD